MTSIRLHRSQWWLLIPLGWVLVGVLGPWLVFPMILLTIFIGGGVSRCGGGSRKLERRREQLRRRQEHFEARRAHWEQRYAGAPAHDRPVARVDLAKRVDSLADLAAAQGIPADVRERAQRLDRECVSTLTYLREHGAPTEQVFEVEQIQTDFGPQALRSYLALAPGSADSAEVLDGKTGHQLIVEQLDLLLDQVAAHLHRAARLGSDQLLANHRFLTEKFGPGGDSELTI